MKYHSWLLRVTNATKLAGWQQTQSVLGTESVLVGWFHSGSSRTKGQYVQINIEMKTKKDWMHKGMTGC